MVQVLILNNINALGYINPFVYPLAILALPFITSEVVLLLLAFIMGLCVDVFSDTGGMHAAALVMLAFCRPYIIRLITPSGGYEGDDRPSIFSMGLIWFLMYSGILLFIHHFTFFFLRIFSFREMGSTLLRVLLSTFCSLLITAMINYVFYSGRPGK